MMGTRLFSIQQRRAIDISGEMSDAASRPEETSTIHLLFFS
jgi:hypothetical protein